MQDDLSLPKNFILELSMGRTMSVGPAKVSAVRSFVCKGPTNANPRPRQQGVRGRVSGV